MTEKTSSTSAIGNAADVEYREYLSRIQRRFMANTHEGDIPLFRTTLDEDSLWNRFLAAIPEEHRQYHTCSACKNFIRRYGDLVTIDSNGVTQSAMWDEEDCPDVYRAPITAMREAIERAKIIGVFVYSDKIWGQPETGPWQHFALVPNPSTLYKSAKLTAGQRMAELRQDYITVVHALNEFPLSHVELASRILENDQLYRGEKVAGPAKWLKELHEARKDKTGLKRDNVTWLAVATAPAGFCHVRSSMIGSLLEDIAAGLSFEDVAAKFKAKMHPLQYQRPTAAPSAGNIEAAEKAFAALGAGPALRRRFARLDEIDAIWRYSPKPEEKPAAESLFGHLKAKSDQTPSMRLPAVNLTWVKFRDTILATADKIELLTPMRASYTAIVTAADPEAVPIIQWDRADRRNPFSWYFWHNGSSATQWRLQANVYVNVPAVTLAPPFWFGNESPNHKQFIFFALDGAQETQQCDNALFPEILKNDYREFRAVVEAYSRNAEIEGMNEPHAAGLAFSGGDKVHLRVTTNGTPTEYVLDRWD